MEGGETKIELTADELREAQNEANLYAIIRAVEYLEKMFVSGMIKESAYECECQTLIAQFKTLQKTLKNKYIDVNEFISENEIYCPLAEGRLECGIPATRMYLSQQSNSKSESLLAFELSGHFITLLDALKLNQTAVDALLPLVQEVVSALGRMRGFDEKHAEEINKIKHWNYTLANMNAHLDLSDIQTRQLSMDVESTYNSFKCWLQSR